MAALNLSYPHGQTWDVARANFEHGVTQAMKQFGAFVKTTEWSPDKTSVRLTGQGFEVRLWVDAVNVSAEGQIPFFAKFLVEKPVMKFLEQTFRPEGGHALPGSSPPP